MKWKCAEMQKERCSKNCLKFRKFWELNNFSRRHFSRTSSCENLEIKEDEDKIENWYFGGKYVGLCFYARSFLFLGSRISTGTLEWFEKRTVWLKKKADCRFNFKNGKISFVTFFVWKREKRLQIYRFFKSRIVWIYTGEQIDTMATVVSWL